jgi:hypothetical protein
MKKLLIAAAAIAIFAGGTAFSQNFSAQYNTSQYAGAVLGVPLTAHYGISDLIWQGTDVRFRVSIVPLFTLTSVSVGADVLTELTTFDDAGRFVLYGGGGPNVGFASFSGVASGFYADVTGLLGVDWRFAEDLSVFVETGAGVGYGAAGFMGANLGGLMFAFRGGLGLLFHF